MTPRCCAQVTPHRRGQRLQHQKLHPVAVMASCPCATEPS